MKYGALKMYYHQVFIDLVSASQRLKQGPNTSAKSRFAVTRHPLLNPHLQRLQHVSSKASVSLENRLLSGITDPLLKGKEQISDTE